MDGEHKQNGVGFRDPHATKTFFKSHCPSTGRLPDAEILDVGVNYRCLALAPLGSRPRADIPYWWFQFRLVTISDSRRVRPATWTCSLARSH
jgi:hypothetical protein